MRHKEKTATGLDISDRSIELVQLDQEKNGLKVRAFSRIEIPEGIIENGIIIKNKEFDKLFNDLLDKAERDSFSFENLIVEIPEELVEYRIVSLTKTVKSENIEEEVLKKLSSELLKKNSEWQYEIYEIFVKDKAKYLFIGIATETLYSYIRRIAEFGLEVSIAEPASYGLIRNIPQNEHGDIVIDFGFKSSMLYFVFNGLTYHRKIINFGSDEIVQKLSKISKISPDKEEKFFIRAGIGPRATSEQIKIIKDKFNKFNSALDDFVQDIKNEFNVDVTEIILEGGLSEMVGLKQILNKKYKVKKIPLIANLNQTIKNIYKSAIGGAYRGVLQENYINEINFLSEKKKKKLLEEIKEEQSKVEKKMLVEKKKEGKKEKNSLKTVFAEKWDYKGFNNKWKVSFQFSSVAQILLFITIGLVIIFGIIFKTTNDKLEESINQSKIESNNISRDFITFSLQLIVSTGENIGDVDTGALLGRFEEYSIEISEIFEVNNELGILSSEDVESAHRVLENKLRSGYKAAEHILTDSNEYLIPEAVFYEETFSSADREIGITTSEFTYTLKATLQLPVVPKNRLDVIIQQNFIKQISLDEKFDDYTIIPVNFRLIEVELDHEVAKYNLTVEAEK